MNTRNGEILKWVLAKIRHEYPDDIALLVVYGSYLTGHSDEWSDIDFFFVPENRRAYSLSRSFIIEGIGYDLFGMNWERLERIASFEETLTPLLGNSRIDHSISEKQAERFDNLKKMLFRNLADYDYMHARAVNRFVKTVLIGEQLQESLSLSECRLLSGMILMELADVIAWENRTYFKYGAKTMMTDLQVMTAKPDGFIDDFTSVIQAKDVRQIKERYEKILRSCRSFLGSKPVQLEKPSDTRTIPPRNGAIDYEALAGWYQEIISTFNKVYKYCRNNDYVMAFRSAVSLQRTINEDAAGLTFDILSVYQADDLSQLFTTVKAVEDRIVAFISREVEIRRYESVGEFIRDNPA
ncbi:MAG: nucleotidyltransferase domain-containing protein [Dehalococcoidales bacterium]|nr:nucleotidyltransferase domain-containing protein [Dehalococcoidales bacterium]